MSISAEIARNVANTTFDVFDSLVIQKACNRIMDVVGCTLAGINGPGCVALLDVVREWGGAPQSTILGAGDKLPVHYAAMVNSVFCRTFDFEPTGALVEGKSTPSHISGTTVPAALSIGEWAGASGKDVLTALIVGEDFAARLASASQLNIDSGWDSTGTVNAFGAAAIAGKLWGLSIGQMINAFGIVLNQIAGTFLNIFDYAHTFKLPQGLAAQAGIFSAALAKKGFTAAEEPLTGKHGYFSLYCKTSRPEILSNDLGKIFCAGDTFKPYPCCRSNHAAVECTLDMVLTHAIEPRDVKEVVVVVTPKAKDFVVGQPFRMGRAPQINAAFSLEYTVANALVRNGARLEHFTDSAISDPSIMAMVKKIRIEPSFPQEKPLGALVKIKTHDGRHYEAALDMPTGSDTLTPLSQDEKREKFMSNVAWSQVVSENNAREALNLLENLSKVENVAVLPKLLIP
jgi:2-methylcitrate dehydratase PrpD